MATQEGIYVYVLDKDNLPKMTYIKTMGEKDGKWLVLSGVNQGDRIITEGIQKVIQGSPVRMVEKVQEETQQVKKPNIFVRVINKIKTLVKGK